MSAKFPREWWTLFSVQSNHCVIGCSELDYFATETDTMIDVVYEDDMGEE